VRTPVFVDWWTFRARGDSLDGPALVEVLSRAFQADLLGLQPELQRSPRGWKGFAHSGELTLAGQTIGQMAWGGAGQGGWVRVSITGTGLGYVADIDAFSRLVIESVPELEHVRVDLAHDCYDRSLLTPGIAEDAWASGGFDPSRGPRPRREWKGSNEGGWTFYVGTRGVSRYFSRVYEKGMKWIGDHGMDAVHPMGAGAGALEDWVRAEVELTNAAGPLPLDVIARRHEYFAGSSAFFASLLPDAEPRRCMVDPVDRAALSLMQGIALLRKQYGPALHTLRHVMGDDRQLLDLLTYACDHSPRLVAGGALLVSGEDVERIKLTRAVQVLALE
jgi:phage replication initiation protein